MFYANVVSLEEYRRFKVREGLRARLHQDLDVWMEGLEGSLESEHPPLEELTEQIFSLRGELMGKIVESFLEERYSEYLSQEVAFCPGCGIELKVRGSYERVVETMVGKVKLSRPYFYCLGCRRGFYPLDEALGLSGKQKQWDIQRRGASLAAEVPYGKAAELFGELVGVSLSDHTLHDVVGEVGEGLGVLDVSPSSEEVLEKIEQVSQGRTWRPVLVLAIDGADVPTRPAEAKGHRRGRKHTRAKRARWKGQYKEAKGFRFYLVDGERIEHLLSWHQVQTEEGLREALGQVKEAGLIPEDRVRLCVVGDGAPWIWKVVEEFFPEALFVLDWYHCSEHLHAVACVQYGHTPEKAVEWMEATVTRLFCGEVEGVMWGLQRMKPWSEEAEQEIAKLVGYLRKNKERVDYGFARKGGYPLGSGGIESSNKLICHVRLKRSGAWWYVEKANEMLALRCAKYNGTFQKVFRLYQHRARQSKATPSLVKNS